MKKAFVLREEPFDGYNWNVGDHLIHAGVDAIVDHLGQFTRTYVNRKRFGLPDPSEHADLLVYAGMPQFAATDCASMDDQAWAMLTHRFPSTRAINVGCGTGYALHVNRLSIAANMVSEYYNNWYYAAQSDVAYVTRDPLSWHFIDLLGPDATLGLCPSHFAAAPPASKKYRVGVSLAHPETKFDQSQKSRLRFELGELYQSLLARHPDALVICQEPVDVEWAKALGITNLVLPQTVAEFYEACGSVEMLISTRVHATVCAVLRNVPTLHLAIDGRSDLLTPLMTCGLSKLNIFWHSQDEILDAAQALVEKGTHIDPSPIIDRFRSAMVDRLATSLKHVAKRRPQPGSVIVNPGHVARMAAGDVIFLTAEHFRANAGSNRDERIVFPFEGIGRHVVFGPYKRLPRGRYEVLFDLEYWGRAGSLDSEMTFDIAVSGDVLAADRIRLSDLLTNRRIVRIEFDHERDKHDVEFRIEAFGHSGQLNVAFSGVRLKAL